MTKDDIRNRVEGIRQQMELLRANYELRLARLTALLRFAQVSCKHEDKYTRSIMGRDTVETCKICGKEW